VEGSWKLGFSHRLCVHELAACTRQLNILKSGAKRAALAPSSGQHFVEFDCFNALSAISELVPRVKNVPRTCRTSCHNNQDTGQHHFNR
jgi:hypothetical protein